MVFDRRPRSKDIDCWKMVKNSEISAVNAE
jgi:hypothetical protein